MFFAFLCFLLVMSLLKMFPNCSAELPSSVPECKKATLGRKYMLDKLPSGTSYSVVGHEFKVTESTIH